MVTTREQAASIAEAILRKWLAVHAEKPSEPAWRADNAGWRMLFWKAHACLLLSSPALAFRELALNCIARTARHLDRGGENGQACLPRQAVWGGLGRARLPCPGGGAGS